MKRIFTFLLSLMSIGAFAQTLDQSNNIVSSPGVGPSPGEIFGQSFTAGISGFLTSVELEILTYTCSEMSEFPVTIYLFDGDNGLVGSILASETIYVPTGITEAVFPFEFSNPAPIISGNSYTFIFDIEGTPSCDGAPGGETYIICSSNFTDDYAGGGRYTNSFASPTFNNSDLFFNTYVSCAKTGMAQINPTCMGGTNGEISLSPVGGTNYTYLWSNAAETTQNLSSLSAGNYTVTMVADGVCIVTESITITDPTIAALTITPSQNNTTCAALNDGDAAIVVSGGLTDYTYLWDNANETTTMISGLGAGTYTVTATDACNITVSESITITDGTPAALTITPSYNDPACEGGLDGDASVVVSGGLTGYSYLWDNANETTAMITGIGTGTYSITATDACGSEISESITISEGTIIGINATVTDVMCFGESGGMVDLDATTLKAVFTYEWSNGETIASVSGLVADTYQVTVTLSSCSKVESFTITEPTALSASLVCTQASAIGATDGTSTATVSGGTTPYSYAWITNSSTTASATGLGAGLITLNLTDMNGCSVTDNCTVAEDLCSNVAISASSTSITCGGGSDGTATVTFTGAPTTNYSYAWSTGATTAVVTGLTAGTKSVTVTESSCSAVTSVTVLEPAIITGTDAVDLCSGESVMIGSLTITTAGVFNKTLTSLSGCDSVVSVSVTLLPNYKDTSLFSTVIIGKFYLCKNQDSLLINGAYYSVGDTALDYTSAMNGCDSAIVGVVEKNTFAASIAVSQFTICQGESYTITATKTGVDSMWWTGISGEVASTLVVAPLDTIWYFMQAKDTVDGCYATDSIKINVKKTPSLSVVENYHGDPLCVDSIKAVTNMESLFTWTLPNGGFIINSSGLLVTQVANTTESYIVSVVNNGCTKTETINVLADAGCGVLGVEELSSAKIDAYISNDKLYVNINRADNQQLSIYDITGKVVYNSNLKSNRTQIEMSSYHKGVYLVNVTDKNGNSNTKKVVY